MIRQIFIGLVSEGKTDNRFLQSIVKRTFDEIGFECNGEVETIIIPIKIDEPGLSFIEKIKKASIEGFYSYGIMILCIHADADSDTDENTLQYKILPAENELVNSKERELCRIITSIVPVQMIEAWMLADRELLKKEIGTNFNDNELGINRYPEQIADPKSVISEAIRIARQDLTKRRRHDLTISDLYLPIGQKVTIDKLDVLPSFQKFKESIRSTYRRLNYLK